MKNTTFLLAFSGIDGTEPCRYIIRIIPPVASVAGREAGLSGRLLHF